MYDDALLELRPLTAYGQGHLHVMTPSGWGLQVDGTTLESLRRPFREPPWDLLHPDGRLRPVVLVQPTARGRRHGLSGGPAERFLAHQGRGLLPDGWFTALRDLLPGTATVSVTGLTLWRAIAVLAVSLHGSSRHPLPELLAAAAAQVADTGGTPTAWLHAPAQPEARPARGVVA